jgi:hypothetical protein
MQVHRPQNCGGREQMDPLSKISDFKIFAFYSLCEFSFSKCSCEISTSLDVLEFYLYYFLNDYVNALMIHIESFSK